MAKKPSLRSANLNLIPVLRALLRDSSVSNAARSLGLSQSATSGALARLRVLLDDPVLVQVGRNMQLTTRAREMSLPLEQLCAALEDLLHRAPFDPAAAEKEFVVAGPDFTCLLVGKSIIEALRRIAPHVSVYFVDVPEDLPQLLHRGEIDLAILDIKRRPWTGLSSVAAFEDEMVGVVDSGHPLARKKRVTAAELEQYPQIRWRSGLHNALPSAVPPPGTRISLYTRAYTALPLLVLNTNSVAMVPMMLARWLKMSLPIAVVPLPYPLHRIHGGLLWSPVMDADPAHSWFRKLIIATLTATKPCAKPERSSSEIRLP